MCSEFSEGVDYDTGDDVLEEQPEEHEVDEVVGETQRSELLHPAVDGAGDVHVDEALDHGVALLLFFRVEIRAVDPVGYNTERVHEHNPQKRHIE